VIPDIFDTSQNIKALEFTVRWLKRKPKFEGTVCNTILNCPRLRELIIFGQQPFYGAELRNYVCRENEMEYNGSDKDISNAVSGQNACMNWLFVTECLKTNITLCINISPYFTENQVRFY